MMSKIRVTGGCQCGAVRYAAEVQPETAHLCHCRMCQKAVGNLFAALVGTATADLIWTRGQPSVFRSSAHVDRGFCQACGTPLFYRAEGANHMSVTIGSLDRPPDVEPAYQVGTEARADWLLDLASLKDFGHTEAGEDRDSVDAIRSTNRQHPDHDTQTWPPQPEA